MPLHNDVKKHIGRLIKPNLGSDPELFVRTLNGMVIGAEKVIPKNGLKADVKSDIVIDGVQLELHPAPSNCRALIANDFKIIFTKLRNQLKEKNAEASFDAVIKMSKEELASLSAAAKQLGCAPSKNVADPTATIKVPKNFRTRSAGGHIHVELLAPYTGAAYPPYNELLLGDIPTLVKVLDCMVGLPSVLIDRDPLAAERRKLYGRASEYRDASQGAAGGKGIEYRVLSNYWLRSYPLMSFAHGMVRQAVNVYAADFSYYNRINKWNAAAELISRVDIEKVWEAINKNSYALALKQWEGVESFIDEFLIDEAGLWTGQSLKNFRFFTEKVKEKGIEYWFPDEPMEHWCSLLEGHQKNEDGVAGWETFILNLVPLVKADADVDDVITKLKGAA